MILVIDKEELTHNIPFSVIIAKITTKGKGEIPMVTILVTQFSIGRELNIWWG